jgi:hypothetical protein
MRLPSEPGPHPPRCPPAGFDIASAPCPHAAEALLGCARCPTCVKPSTISFISALRDAFETGHTINVPYLASEMTESLADLIVCSAPSEEQPGLIAHVVAELGRFVKEKGEAGVGAQLQ